MKITLLTLLFSIKAYIFLCCLAMLFLPASADAFDISDLDPTNPNSAIRKGGVRIDPTNPNSETRRQLRRFDERRREIMHLGRQGCVAKANNVKETNGSTRSNRGLSRSEFNQLKAWFGNHINLNRVTVRFNSRLNNEMRVGGYTLWVASAAQTFGNQIFFKAPRRRGDTKQLIDIAHELIHVKQAADLGGVGRFCEEYMNGWAHGFNYYDNPMEREAQDVEFDFARWLSNRLPRTGQYYEIEHGHPNNSRTVRVPHRYN